MSDSTIDDDGISDELGADATILREVRRRFDRCKEWESTARTRFVADMKFCYGDAYNNYQWPSALYSQRDSVDKPALTINKTHQHCLQIINDARQNKTGVEVRPVGEGASEEAAKVFEGIIRHIEYISNAQAAYDTATWNQVVGGIGWLRVVTDYANKKSFDQEIFIRRVPNALSVYLDPDIQQYDGSDARFGFVFRDMPREEFDRAYPKLKNTIGSNFTGDTMNNDGDWINDDHVRICEYFRTVEDRDHLIALIDGTVILESESEPETMKAMAMSFMDSEDASDAIRMDGDEPMRREVSTSRIEWFEIAGDKIAKRRDWPGMYIPLIRVVGEETVIDGEMDRRGHTRALINPQQMYNFWSSAAVEQVALQTKTPWKASMEAVGPYEEYYKNANLINAAWMPWVEYDEQGRKTTPPDRLDPPVMADAFLKGMQVSANEMMMVSGQYQAVMGAQSNETSGKAINARQRQGDNATYHFIDHLGQAIRHLGKVLIDLIPHIYDTARVVRTLDEAGEETEVHIDPSADVAHQSQETAPMPGQDGQPESKPDVRVIFNPGVGQYDVVADVGPSYATQRQEAFNAFVQIMQANPEMMDKVGDLMFKAADFPMASEIAERLNDIRLGNTVPKEIVEKLKTALVEMQKKSGQTIGQLVQQIAEMQLDAKKKDVQVAEDKARGADGAEDSAADTLRAQTEAVEASEDMKIKEYDAETRRMVAMGNIDPEALRPIVREMVSQLLGEPVVPIMAKHAEADQARQPEPEPAEVE